MRNLVKETKDYSTKNNKKKKLLELQYTFASCMLVIGFVSTIGLFGLGLYLFESGFHSLDLGQNMRYLNAKLNITTYDVCVNLSSGEPCTFTSSAEDVYLRGVYLIHYSIPLIILGSFMLGIYLCMLLSGMDEEKKRKERELGGS